MGFAEPDLEDISPNLFKPGLWSLLTKVSELLKGQGIKAYLVGGLVRDALRGRDTADIDIALAGDALAVAPEVAVALGGRYVLLDKVNRVGRVVLFDRETQPGKMEWELDFSSFAGSIEQDLARRDFTIDAMSIDLEQLVRQLGPVPLIDPLHGRDDLREGVIRVVAETAFSADASRLLRAVRLAAELGFNIENNTESLIRRDATLLSDVAGERIREELLRLLSVSRGGQFLSYLDELGLLTAIFPDLVPTKGVTQPKEHHWDVFRHSINTVTAVDFLLREGVWEGAGGEILAPVPWSATLEQHFEQEVSCGSTRRGLLKLAALLHDVAKPLTKAIIAGRTRFLGHAPEGAAIVATALERLRFSTREIKLVEIEVKHHLRPGQLSQTDLPTRRAIYRYFRDTGEAGIDILFLSLADHLATRGPNLELSNWREHCRMTEYVLAQRFQEEKLIRPIKLVDGHDIISIFGLKPGPKVGEILEAVREAQASGIVTGREQALTYIRNRLVSKTE